MSSDAEMVTGGQSADVMFENQNIAEDDKKLIDKEREEIIQSLPNAENRLSRINKDIANLNQLTDFIDCLGALPSDVRPTNEDLMQIVYKLELRFLAINQLVDERERLKNGLVDIGQKIDLEPIVPAPLKKPLTIYREKIITKTVAEFESRPHGFKAIWQGIKDLFMKQQ